MKIESVVQVKETVLSAKILKSLQAKDSRVDLTVLVSFRIHFFPILLTPLSSAYQLLLPLLSHGHKMAGITSAISFSFHKKAKKEGSGGTVAYMSLFYRRNIFPKCSTAEFLYI